LELDAAKADANRGRVLHKADICQPRGDGQLEQLLAMKAHMADVAQKPVISRRWNPVVTVPAGTVMSGPFWEAANQGHKDGNDE